MELFLIYAFVCYGMTNIIMWGSIFETPRGWMKAKSSFLNDLLSCTLCTSTWVGFITSIFLGSITECYFDTFYLFNVFFDGMFAAGIVWFINTIIEYFENKNAI